MSSTVIIVIWICAIVVFAIIEALTMQLVCIWFAISALVSLIVALFDTPFWLQSVVFAVCTALLLVFTRPVVKRFMNKPRVRTNADRVIGMTALVTQEINNDNAVGLVKVTGQTWTARSLSGNIIPIDAKVKVNAIEGVKLIVEETE